MISNLMAQLGNHTNTPLDESLIRHMIINSIRNLNVQFSNEYGEIIIACDSKNYWRKNYFPYYKASRKKAYESSEIDWNSIFDFFKKIKAELREFFKYRVIEIDEAEADDIIGTLALNFGNFLNTGEKILIISGDKDFIQLQKYGNIKQYDPVRKTNITHHNPNDFLVEHIIKGDTSDGVPNILSKSDIFVVGGRQTPLTAKRLSMYTDMIKTNQEFTDEIKNNFERNKKLIELSQIPDNIQSKIMSEYENQKGKNNSKIITYFIQNKMKLLLEHINDF